MVMVSNPNRNAHSAVALFIFQAEDGIRDLYVTGVQTCALPISGPRGRLPDGNAGGLRHIVHAPRLAEAAHAAQLYIYDFAGAQPDRLFQMVRGAYAFRSEERRVGKECRSRVSPARDMTGRWLGA